MNHFDAFAETSIESFRDIGNVSQVKKLVDYILDDDDDDGHAYTQSQRAYAGLILLCINLNLNVKTEIDFE